LHFFEGWVVFIVAAMLLLGVIWLLVKLLPGRQSLLDALSWRADAVPSASPTGKYAFPANQVWTIAILMFVAIAGAAGLSGRGEMVPERKPLSDFPVVIGEWTARVDRLPSLVEEVAGASEYFYGDFSAPSGEMVNAYVSYYENQRHGQIPHSPKVCIPGGGWVIETLNTATVSGKTGSPFTVNRIVTGLGKRKVISLYWLKQGSQVYHHELLARLDLVRLSLLEDRTDGALIRLVTELRPGESMEAGDTRLKRFAAEFVDLIPPYVPD
jgi:EpsI family protein